MIKMPYKVDVTVDGEVIEVTSLSINQSMNSLFSSATITISEPSSFQPPNEEGITALKVCVFSVTSGNKAVLGGKGFITGLGRQGNVTKLTNTLTIFPSSYLLQDQIGTFDGTSNTALYFSAKKLIEAIILQYNTDVAGSDAEKRITLSFDCGNREGFTNMVGPRFIGMTYADMINQIIAPRNLKAKIGFDNILHIFALAAPSSSNVQIFGSSMKDISENINELITQ